MSRKFGFLILRLSETRPCQMPSRRSRETRCAMHFFRGRENSIRRERNEAREIGRVRSERVLRSSDLRDLRHPRHAFGGGTSTGGGQSRLRSPRTIDDPATKRSAVENSSEIGFHAYRRQSRDILGLLSWRRRAIPRGQPETTLGSFVSLSKILNVIFLGGN